MKKITAKCQEQLDAESAEEQEKGKRNGDPLTVASLFV